MTKVLFVGLWVCLVALGSTYASIVWRASRPPPQQGDQPTESVETLKTRLISVPIITKGSIHGYLMAQFAFTIEGKTLKRLTVKPDVYLIDEAFKILYGSDLFDFREVKAQELPAISKMIMDNTNNRLGGPVIRDVLIQEFTYLSKDQVRRGER
jgi:hypothetical protein